MQVTRTLKIKFHRLDLVKASIFAKTTVTCTELANKLLKLPVKERKKLTTAKVVTFLIRIARGQNLLAIAVPKQGKAEYVQLFLFDCTLY